MKPNKNMAINALLTGASMKEAASKAGVTPDTLSRWMGQAEFAGKLQELVDATAAGVVAALVSEAKDMVDVLAHLARNEETPVVSRVAAAKGVLAHLKAMKDSQDNTARLKALEAFFKKHFPNEEF